MTVINEEFKKNVGKRLQELRKHQNLTINEVVEKLSNDHYSDIDARSIRRYEKGEFLPKIDNLIALSELFDTTLDYIIYGKETSDDNSYTWYDNFKRLNRLIYSLCVDFKKDDITGRYYLELWEEEAKLYWEKLNSYGVTNNYFFEKRQIDPSFSVKELDALVEEFAKYKEQNEPTKERMDKFLLHNGINPHEFLMEKLRKLKP